VGILLILSVPKTKLKRGFMPLHMLVAIGDTIKIGDDIVIKYVKRMGNNVGLAITAPISIKINREKGEDNVRKNTGINGNSGGVDRNRD